jgi:D-alanyl-D-alanine carboxypeptidase (penicillin-binding protein 5/6)
MDFLFGVSPISAVLSSDTSTFVGLGKADPVVTCSPLVQVGRGQTATRYSDADGMPLFPQDGRFVQYVDRTMRRFITTSTLLSVFAALVVHAAPTPAHADTPSPSTLQDVTADSYLVADFDTGQILAAKNPHARLRPASTQKILTALALIPVLDPAMVHTAVPADIADLATTEPGASAVGVRPGLTYRVPDLWNGVFLRSGNDAIATLVALAGGLPKTLSLMRTTARLLHATDTSVVNADGYDADGQLSSAYDLALMARAGLADPAFRAYCSLRRANMPSKAGATYEIDNENRLLGRYPGMIGVKNGYTTLAKHTFVGAAQHGSRTLIVTIMGAGPDVYQQTAKLLGWGFATASAPDPALGTLVTSDPLPRSERAPAGATPQATAPQSPTTPAKRAARKSAFFSPLGGGLGTAGLLLAATIVAAVLRRQAVRRSRPHSTI